MKPPISENLKLAFIANPSVDDLFKDVADVYQLTPVEVRALAAAILTPDHPGFTVIVAAGFGLTGDEFKDAVRALVSKGLLWINDGRIDIRPAHERLEVPAIDQTEDCRVALRSLVEVVKRMSRGRKTPAAGLAAVYEFLFARKVLPREWGLLGKLANLIGAENAAVLMLEHATRNTGGIITEVYKIAARIRADEFDTGERDAALREAMENTYRGRMAWWLRNGGLKENLALINQKEAGGEILPEQAERDRDRCRQDFAEWERRGRPEEYRKHYSVL